MNAINVLQKRSLINAFSLIELVIVLGIIALLSVVTIPLFEVGSKKRNFTKSIDSIVEEIRATRQKAISGVMISGNEIDYWLFDPRPNPSDATNCNSIDIIARVAPSTDILVKSVNFDDIKFTQCPSDQSDAIRFNRFSGFVDTLTIPTINLKHNNSSQEAIITVNKFGNISTEIN